MTIRSSDSDKKVSELLALIEQSPTDVRSRLQLLEILYANNRVDEFVMEALEFKINCDLADGNIWGQVCMMGREIDPGNCIFIETPTTNMQSTQGEFRSDPQGGTGSKSEFEPKHVLAKSISNTEVKRKDMEYGESERRNEVERRVEDRRMFQIMWPDGERRNTTRRSRKRRSSED